MAKFLEENTPASYGYSATSDQEPNVCEACRNISSSSLREKLSAPPYCWSSYSLVNRDISDDRGMVHLRNARSLKSSAEACTLCSLMAREFCEHFRLVHATKDPWGCVKETPIFLGPRLDRGRRHNFPYSDEWCAKLDGMQVWIPVDDKKVDPLRDGYMSFCIRFYTDDEKDSPHTFRDITTRLPIEYTGSSLAFSRLNTFITACQDDHAKCMKTIAGATLNPNEKPTMPTRVIDIGPKGSS
ncbi:uncharacterized protein FTJAE_686 [Fusarium tjaetaba]|uniref:Uncharacterized protein n=1 Tax=Fusarium tjaetaba TaxID=1567544 RepID=A0A8H5SGD1_9HYPO|nr:uncharacterized protein FTJAE_686 [Fusarium tjaetaba]KAF5650121.1 hypothetical protein FTJAE_686 [Fusarium tjaetaba]